MRFSKAVVKCRIPILILALLLMIPSAVGMAKTRINYDMLDYLPEDMDTVIGQNDLMEDFGKGAFSFIVVDGMSDRDVDSLCERIKQVEHVETVLWYSSLADITIPKELRRTVYITSSTTVIQPLLQCFWTAQLPRMSPWTR